MKSVFTTKTLLLPMNLIIAVFLSQILDAQDINGISSEISIPSITLSNDTPPMLIPDNKEKPSKPDYQVKKPENSQAWAITIIESQSINSGHTMDVNWLNVATLMGNTAVIEPQTTLDNTDLIGFTDILILSSGVIDIPLTRRAVIQQFIEQGGPVYIQAEYQSSYQANQTFQQIVNNLGGNFSWGATVSGDLNPMYISGPIGSQPNSVPSLSYFWYGCEGTGDGTLEANMNYLGQFFGFIFTPPDANNGVVICNSDQDWAREAPERDLLMENIITYLSDNVQTGIHDQPADESNSLGSIDQNYPNPVISKTKIKYFIKNDGFVSIKVLNLLGKEMEVLESDYLSGGVHYAFFEKGTLPEGAYFYQMKLDDKVVGTKKMMITR